jgi:quinoprotein relay system zinc metallohydrolase 1
VKWRRIAATLSLLMGWAPWHALAQTQHNYALTPRPIAPGTWVLEGAVDDFRPANGCNIINTAFIATGAGVVVVNTGPSRRYGEQQRQAIARVTDEPVVKVLNLNLHPDYFFGNQAWADRPTAALPGSIAGMAAEGPSYATNLYRLCGNAMAGTEPTPAREALKPGPWQLGTHRLELLRLDGHTGDDLVMLDHSTGVVFAGGLVFAQRVPTTPHADFTRWLASLQTLQALVGAGSVVVPSHGPVHAGHAGIAQTRDWLHWAQATMAQAAEQGLDIGELMRQPLPERFAGWAAQPAEWHRTLAQFYPGHEARALLRAAPRQ